MLNLVDNNSFLKIDKAFESYMLSASDSVVKIENEVDCTIFLNLANVNNLDLRVNVKENTTCTIMLWTSGNEFLKTKQYFTLEENAILTLAYGDMSYHDNCHDIVVDLLGQGSRAYVKSAILCKNNKHYDLRVNSKVSHTYGEMENYCVVLDDGNFYLDAVGKIEKGCHGSKSHQTSRALCFSGKQKATIIPELLIDDNDVEASHATSVGTIDQQQLFYMQSRGLTQKDALGLITLGYLSFITKVIDNETINSFLQKEIESKVGLL